jgi:putative transposase
VAQHFVKHFGLSQRRACELVKLQRCSFRYRSRKPDDTVVRLRLKELAQERPRFGYPQLYILLKREGWSINRKKVYRLYREENLKLRPKKRKRSASSLRVRPTVAMKVNHIWIRPEGTRILSVVR